VARCPPFPLFIANDMRHIDRDNVDKKRSRAVNRDGELHVGRQELHLPSLLRGRLSNLPRLRPRQRLGRLVLFFGHGRGRRRGRCGRGSTSCSAASRLCGRSGDRALVGIPQEVPRLRLGGLAARWRWLVVARWRWRNSVLLLIALTITSGNTCRVVGATVASSSRRSWPREQRARLSRHGHDHGRETRDRPRGRLGLHNLGGLGVPHGHATPLPKI
jgi:hypothetical protein